MARPKKKVEDGNTVAAQPQPERRARRTRPSGHRDILTIADKDPNYFYRWVLDSPGRVEMMKERGYVPVTKENVQEVGDPTVDRGSQLGSVVTMVRGPQQLVLMRILREWYDEDQKYKQDDIDALEATMGKGAGDYGNVSISRK